MYDGVCRFRFMPTILAPYFLKLRIVYSFISIRDEFAAIRHIEYIFLSAVLLTFNHGIIYTQHNVWVFNGYDIHRGIDVSLIFADFEYFHFDAVLLSTVARGRYQNISMLFICGFKSEASGYEFSFFFGNYLFLGSYPF